MKIRKVIPLKMFPERSKYNSSIDYGAAVEQWLKEQKDFSQSLNFSIEDTNNVHDDINSKYAEVKTNANNSNKAKEETLSLKNATQLLKTTVDAKAQEVATNTANAKSYKDSASASATSASNSANSAKKSANEAKAVVVALSNNLIADNAPTETTVYSSKKVEDSFLQRNKPNTIGINLPNNIKNSPEAWNKEGNIPFSIKNSNNYAGIWLHKGKEPNSRILHIQAGHSDFLNYAHITGTINLNPFGGEVHANGYKVYSIGFKPSPEDIGAYSKAEVDSNFFRKNTSLKTDRDVYLEFPNTRWNSSLRVGGNGYTANAQDIASVTTTNGNLHLDSGTKGRAIYLQYYTGGKVLIGNNSFNQITLDNGTVDAHSYKIKGQNLDDRYLQKNKIRLNGTTAYID